MFLFFHSYIIMVVVMHMLTKENRKEIFKIILFTVILIFAFIHIKEIWHFLGFIFQLVMPFILGIVIAFVLNILIKFIERKLLNKAKMKEKSKRTISLLLSLAIVFTFIVVLLLLIIPQLKNTVSLFVDNMPMYEENVQEILDRFSIDPSIIQNIEEGITNFGDTAVEFIKNNRDQILEVTLGVASNVITVLVNLVIAFVFAIYLLVQKEKLFTQIDHVLKAYLPITKVSKLEKVAQLTNRICASFVSGQCLEAVIIGVLCFIGMLLLGIPYAATISVLIGVTALIPVYGAFIGTIVGAFLIFMVSPIKAVIFVIFILILQQFEGNLIYPKVVGKSVGLPGIWVFVAVTIGASLAGVVGMLISVPVASICYSILATDVHYRLEAKKAKKILAKKKNS